MIPTAFYRKSSNEIIKISLKGQQFTENSIFSALTDPTIPGLPAAQSLVTQRQTELTAAQAALDPLLAVAEVLTAQEQADLTAAQSAEAQANATFTADPTSPNLQAWSVAAAALSAQNKLIVDRVTADKTLIRQGTPEGQAVTTAQVNLRDAKDALHVVVSVRPKNPDGELGDLRILGFAKIADPGSNNVRDATQLEIDTFEASEIDDSDQQDTDRAADLGDLDPITRRLVKSILKGAVREHNIIANRYNELRAEMLLASNFNDSKTRIAASTQNAPTRTNQQAFDAVRPDVSKGD